MYRNRLFVNGTGTWDLEFGERWPGRQVCWITTNADPLTVRRRWAVQDEQLEPSRRAGMCVGRCGDCAHIALA